MSCTIRPRWWHWLFGVLLPLHTIAFELLTFQISGTMFDPMVTPWHALMLMALPVGYTLAMLASERAPLYAVAGLCMSFSLPLLLLIAWAIGGNYLNVMLKLVFGIVSMIVHPTEAGEVMFGDFSLSPISALAYLGPISGCVTGILLLRRGLVCHWPRVASFGFLAGLCVVVYHEHRSSDLEQMITQASELTNSGQRFEQSNLVADSRAQELVARLSRPGQQFSSHGELYAVGPVDVFGPWTYLRRGRPHPVTWLFKTKWPNYMKLHEALWPRQAPAPKSWRGLSPWEQYRMSHPDLL